MESLMSNPWFIFVIGFLGMVAHFLKKYSMNQLQCSEVNPINSFLNYYFKRDILNTITTVIAYIVVFFVMYQMGETTVFASFSGGYMCDSILNKAEERGLKVG